MAEKVIEKLKAKGKNDEEMRERISGALERAVETGLMTFVRVSLYLLPVISSGLGRS